MSSTVVVVCTGRKVQHPERKLGELLDERSDEPATPAEYVQAFAELDAWLGWDSPRESVERAGLAQWRLATKVTYRGRRVRRTTRGGVKRTVTSRSMSVTGEPRIFAFHCSSCGHSPRMTEAQIERLMVVGPSLLDIATIV
jgi:hypothetical protein